MKPHSGTGPDRISHPGPEPWTWALDLGPGWGPSLRQGLVQRGIHGPGPDVGQGTHPSVSTPTSVSGRFPTLKLNRVVTQTVTQESTHRPSNIYPPGSELYFFC